MNLTDDNILEYISFYKSRENVTLTCDYCSSSFLRIKKEIQNSLKNNIKKSFCNIKCSSAFKSTKQQYNCKNCNKEIFRTKSQLKDNIYCSQHCSGICSSKVRIHSELTKKKISKSLLNNPNRYQPSKEEILKGIKNRIKKSTSKKTNEFICLHCGEKDIDNRYNSNRKYHLNCWNKISGGIKEGSSRGKSGYYKEHWCDSSYELAFIIYCIENNIEFFRNKIGFPYLYKNKKHLFYPDFIVNQEYIEIKNYKSDLTEAKIQYFPNKLRVLYKEDMKFYISYAINKYGKDFIKLYNGIVK